MQTEETFRLTEQNHRHEGESSSFWQEFERQSEVEAVELKPPVRDEEDAKRGSCVEVLMRELVEVFLVFERPKSPKELHLL